MHLYQSECRPSTDRMIICSLQGRGQQLISTALVEAECDIT